MKRVWYIVALSAVLLVGCIPVERPADALEPVLRPHWPARGGYIKDIRLPCLRRECGP